MVTVIDDQDIVELISIALNLDLSGHALDQCLPLNLPQWDSLAHVTLMLMIEEKYGLSFTPEDIEEAMAGGEVIKSLLQIKLG